jgi:hypothetical protein
MTFSKERLEELKKWLDAMRVSKGIATITADSMIAEAAALLPQYIEAVSKAEQDLIASVKRMRAWTREHGTDPSTEIIIMGCNSTIEELFTLSQPQREG